MISMDARWPVEISGIEPIAHLGSGGFGQVWLANQTSLNRKVAVKVSHIPFATEDDKRRFDRECQALGQLGGHPHIIEVYTSGESNGLPYLVLQYVDGGTLAERGQSLTEDELRTATDQLCQAVAAAHDRGVLHRDLKPENVFLQKDGTVILGDFGIARLGDGNNTAAMGVTGSMAFVAPEVLQGQPPSAQADVYGIAITVISAVLGRSPYVTTENSGNIHTIINRVIEARPPDLSQTGLSGQFQNLLLQTMAAIPAQRPQTVQQLQTQLNQLAPAKSEATQIAPPPLASPPPPMNVAAPAQQPPAPHQNRSANNRAAAAPPPPRASQTPHPPATLPQPVPFSPAPQNAPGVNRPPVKTSGGSGGKVLAIAALGVGGVLVLAMLVSLLSGDSNEPTQTLTGTSSTQVTLDDSSDSSDTDVSGSTIFPETSITVVPSTTTTTQRTGPLVLPLTEEDILGVTGMSEGSEGFAEVDLTIDEITVCNTPSRPVGRNEVIANEFPKEVVDFGESFQFVSQGLGRFSSADQAAAYLASEGAVSCEPWEQIVDTFRVINQPKAIDLPTTYGDEVAAFDITTTFPDGGESIYSRTVLIRSGADTYQIAYLSYDQGDVAPKTNALLDIAIQRLGY